MKQNKILKASILGMAATATVAMPVVLAVSCKEEQTAEINYRYDTTNDNKLTILHTFGDTSSQKKALDLTAQHWNESKTASQPVLEIEKVTGYADIEPELTAAFTGANTEAKSKLPNLILGYPDALGAIAKYDMELELDESEDHEIANLFPKDFLEMNDEIGGLESGHTYALPVGKSVEMNSINKPVLGKILSDAFDNGLITSSINPNTDEIELPSKINVYVEYYKNTISEDERNAIDTKWVKNTNFERPNQPRYNDTIFSDYEKQLNFAIDARKMYADNKNLFIEGFDSPANLIYTMVYSKVGADINDFLFSKGTDGKIHYNYLDKSSEAYNAFKSAYELVKRAQDAGAIAVLGAGGKFVSSYLTSNSMAMAVGSTAGYDFNYVPNTTPTYPVTTGDGVITLDGFTFELSPVSGQEWLAEFDHHKKVFPSTYTGVVGADDYKLADSTQDSKFQTLLTSAVDPKKFVISSANSLSETALNSIGQDNYIKVSHGDADRHPKYMMVADNLTNKSVEADTLQRGDLEVVQVASKFGSGNTSADVALIQGPSLYGVHTNDIEDKATREFVKWFLTSTVAEDDLSTSYDERTLTEAESFARKANYILGTKKVLGSATPTSTNPGMILAYNVLRDTTSEGTNLHPFDNPVDDTTNMLRTDINTMMRKNFTDWSTGSNTLTFDELYTQLDR